MKKTLALLIAAVMMLSLAACGNSGKGGSSAQEETKPPKVADETSVMDMTFKAPAKYKEVGRYVSKSVNGIIKEKDIKFNFDDDSSIIYACNFDTKLDDMLSLDSLKKEKYNGVTYYIYESKPVRAALVQRGKDVYGFSYNFADKIDNKLFKAKMKEITFSKNGTIGKDNDDDLYAIKYSFKKSWKKGNTESNYYETPDGKVTSKDISWSFGKDEDKPDFRFMIKVVKNTKVSKELPDSYKTKKTKLGGVSYTAVYDTDTSKNPFAYFTQQGKDVYQIRNKGVSSGWFIDRSDESYEAFDTFMKSISFK